LRALIPLKLIRAQVNSFILYLKTTLIYKTGISDALSHITCPHSSTFTPGGGSEIDLLSTETNGKAMEGSGGLKNGYFYFGRPDLVREKPKSGRSGKERKSRPVSRGDQAVS
jgi:hypothetical protein